jgi:hypothetical protein
MIPVLLVLAMCSYVDPSWNRPYDTKAFCWNLVPEGPGDEGVWKGYAWEIEVDGKIIFVGHEDIKSISYQGHHITTMDDTTYIYQKVKRVKTQTPCRMWGRSANTTEDQT